MREDLSDGILVGAVQRSVLGSCLSTLVKTFELVHGTVCVCVCARREWMSCRQEGACVYYTNEKEKDKMPTVTHFHK